MPDGPEARWIGAVRLSPFQRSVLAHLATLRDTPPGLLQRMAWQGWWFLNGGRLYPALYRLERLRLVDSEWNEPPPADPDKGRRRIYGATRLGLLWLELHAADASPLTRLEWRILATIGEIGGTATGIGLRDFLEVGDRKLVRGLRALEASGYVAIEWCEADLSNYTRGRFNLTDSGRRLLELRHATHGG